MGSGQSTTIKQLAETILKLSKQKLDINFVGERGGDIKNSYADISKMRRMLGFEPSISLNEGLRGLYALKVSENQVG